MASNFLQEFGRFPIPKNIRPQLRKYLFKAGITDEPYSFFGGLFFFSIFLTFILYFTVFYGLLQSFKEKMSLGVFLVLQGFGTIIIWSALMLIIIGLIIVSIYTYLDIKIFNRTRMLEEILPDFLEAVSSNLKGGMSFEKSLWMSIQPKYGVLASEIALASKKVMTGNDVDIALTEFSLKYNSPMLKRSMNLVISQIQSGGEISLIIDKIVADLKKTKLLKEEMSASVLTYMIFISAIVVVISPVLFGLSYALLNVISSITALLGASLGSVDSPLPFDFSNSSIDPSMFVFPFSFCAIGITAIGSSLIVSIIEKGNIKGGLKYIPIFLVSSLCVYWVALQVMGALAGLVKF
jgi:pilus assembly protein TadC